jgi:hypothetical protein
MARIVTVYRNEQKEFLPVDMSYIRWLKISEALARRGHDVDIATNEKKNGVPFPVSMAPGLRRVQLSDVCWSDYDVVKTVFHSGFDTLEEWGGTGHPFIISKLGSVVAHENREGIHFYGEIRHRLYQTQEKIAMTSHYVTVLSTSAKELLNVVHGRSDNVLLVPGGADDQIPEAGEDPFPDNGMRVIFAGNIYSHSHQPEANRILVEKLNALGKALKVRGACLYFLGPGDVTGLDCDSVIHIGPVVYEKAWNYLQYAHAGVVVVSGSFLHNNESTKIYHYLRAGLPCVVESGFPNQNLVRECELGFIAENGNMERMADLAVEACRRDWNRDSAIDHIRKHHTWDQRVEVYDRLLRKKFEP